MGVQRYTPPFFTITLGVFFRFLNSFPKPEHTSRPLSFLLPTEYEPRSLCHLFPFSGRFPVYLLGKTILPFSCDAWVTPFQIFQGVSCEVFFTCGF